MKHNEYNNEKEKAEIPENKGVDLIPVFENAVYTSDIPVYDIVSVYLHAFQPEDSYEKKLSHLVHLFCVDKEYIRLVLNNMDVPRIATWPEVKRYLENISTQSLEKIYNALTRQHFYYSARRMATIMERIINERKLNDNIFRKASNILEGLNDESDIYLWDQFEIDFNAKTYLKEHIIEKIKKITGGTSFTACVFAIINGRKCLYIGTGNLTGKGIMEKHKEYGQQDNTTQWIDFFSGYKKNLQIYWKGLKIEMSDVVGTGFLKLSEVLFREIHHPLFDKFNGVQHK